MALEYRCPECNLTLDYEIKEDNTGEFQCVCGYHKDRDEFITELRNSPKEKEGKNMASKKGKCVECGEEKTIVAKGLCWKCYDKSRGKGSKAKEKPEPEKRKYSRGGGKVKNKPSIPGPAIPVSAGLTGITSNLKIGFDIEINIRNVRVE